MVIKVLVADDHKLIVEGVRLALESADDISVVATASDGAQVLPQIHQTNPDVVLLDLRMPRMNGLTCLDAIRKKHPAVKVVILSAFSGEEHIRSAIDHGATAFVVKSVNPVDLPSVVRQAFESTVYQGFHILTSDDENPATKHGLTEREVSVLKALSRGLSNQELGKEFWITEQTVKFHLSNIYRKIGVTNRTAAARFAHDSGMAGGLL